MASFRTRLRSRAAHLSFLMTRPMTLGVRAVVIDANDSVLLVRHGYVSGWHFPGGGVEVGETCMQALTRELEEEARVEIRGAPVLHGLFFNAETVAPRPRGGLCDPRFRGAGRARARSRNRGSPLLWALRPAGERNGGHARAARRDLRFGPRCATSGERHCRRGIAASGAPQFHPNSFDSGTIKYLEGDSYR